MRRLFSPGWVWLNRDTDGLLHVPTIIEYLEPTMHGHLLPLAFVIYGLSGSWVFHSIGHLWAGAFGEAIAFAGLIAVTIPVVSH